MPVDGNFFTCTKHDPVGVCGAIIPVRSVRSRPQIPRLPIWSPDLLPSLQYILSRAHRSSASCYLHTGTSRKSRSAGSSGPCWPDAVWLYHYVPADRVDAAVRCAPVLQLRIKSLGWERVDCPKPTATANSSQLCILARSVRRPASSRSATGWPPAPRWQAVFHRQLRYVPRIACAV